MSKRVCIAVCLLLAAFCQSKADELPQLAPASEIVTGTLPDGIQYYVVSSPREKGFADFSLVQRDFHQPELARQCLVSLPHFAHRRPCDFLLDHGVRCPEDGFVSFRSGNAIWNFPTVPVGSPAVCDSTLLMLLDIASASSGNQAVVIAGNVDAGRIIDRLGLLSLMVPKRSGASIPDEYRWTPKDSPSFYYTGSPSGDLASIRISYSASRTPKDRMNTFQPVVTRQYATYFGLILDGRIREAFRTAGLPLAKLEYRYRDSSGSPGDEMYTITVTTSADKYESAVSLVASVLSGLDSRGATAGELESARARLVSEASREAGNHKLANSEYVLRCVNSYLYGAALASDATINEIFTRSALSVSDELPLFNSFVSALVDSKENLIIGFDTPHATVQDGLPSVFDSSWAAAAADSTLVYRLPSKEAEISLAAPMSKVRIVSESPEPVTGGTMFKLSNGVRAVFSKTDLKGKFHFALMVRGGAGLVEGLRPGENAYVADLLDLCDVSGRTGADFRRALAEEGVTVHSDVSLTDLRITGEAPTSKLPLVLKALTSISKVNAVNSGAFEYYRKCAALESSIRRHSSEGVRDVVDSLLAPAYPYRIGKSLVSVPEDLAGRASGYFNVQFSRCSDGVMAFLGDLDVETFKKQIVSYAGELTGGKAGSSRPRLQSRSFAGEAKVRKANCSNPAVKQTVCLARAASFNLNISVYSALRTACLAIQGELSKATLPLGYSCAVDLRTELFPQECGIIYITCRPCSLSGLPEGVVTASPDDVASAVNRVLAGLSSNMPDIAPFKTQLLSEMAVELGETSGKLASVLTRYSEGKDLSSSYEKAVASVTADQVKTVISTLNSGRSVQYVVL